MFRKAEYFSELRALPTLKALAGWIKLIHPERDSRQLLLWPRISDKDGWPAGRNAKGLLPRLKEQH